MKYSVKITNLSFELEFQPIWEIDPPKPEKPIEPEKPPVVTPMPPLDSDEWFYSQLADPNVERITIDKDIRISVIKDVTVARTLYIVGNGATVIIGIENYKSTTGTQSSNLITLANGSRIFISGVNFCSPEQLKTSQPWSPSLFKAPQDPNAEWSVVVQNCDTTKNGRNAGWGLGFIYGGTKTNIAILQNFTHCGPALMDAKNPYKDSVLQLVLDNVNASFPDKSEFGDSIISCTGYVKDDRFHITSEEVDTHAFYDNYAFGESSYNNNFVTIIHIGRYTLQWDGKQSNLDMKTVKLRNSATGRLSVFVDTGRLFIPQREAHAGQTLTINGQKYTIMEKDRTEFPEWAAWGEFPVTRKVNELAYRLDRPIQDGDYEAVFDDFKLDLNDQDVYLIYKGNMNYRTTINTKFGNDWTVMQCQYTGHQCYNHDNISIWANKAILDGYYRQTDNGLGNNLGVNLQDCNKWMPEFNPNVPVTSLPIPMPQKAIDLLAELDRVTSLTSTRT